MNMAATDTGPANGGGEILDRRECLALLASVPVGRIVYTEQALPAVSLVNFVVSDGTVVIRTAWGSKLAAAARHAIVAFEADQYDDRTRTGWSVTAVGHAWVVEQAADPEKYAELGRLGLQPWAPGPREHYIRIAIERVSGRRINAPAPASGRS